MNITRNKIRPQNESQNMRYSKTDKHRKSQSKINSHIETQNATAYLTDAKSYLDAQGCSDGDSYTHTVRRNKSQTLTGNRQMHIEN